jgi:hypothetical protein
VHATIHEFRRPDAGESAGWGEALAADLHPDAPLGSCVLAQLGGSEGRVVAFWPTAEDAATASARRTATGPIWLDATSYRVIQADSGRAADRAPAFAQLTCFDGPRSQAVADAGERAGRERIWPAVQHLPGIVSVYVLDGPDGARVVLGLSTDLGTPDAVRRAVFATELLPGEDPALLSDPDRVLVERVVAAELPVLAGRPS